MHTLNQTCKYIGAIAICFFSTMSSIANGVNLENSKENEISIQDAERIVAKAYKKHTKNKIKNFTCRQITENQEVLAFGCEATNDRPRPGGVLFINIDKVSGKLTVYHGK